MTSVRSRNNSQHPPHHDSFGGGTAVNSAPRIACYNSTSSPVSSIGAPVVRTSQGLRRRSLATGSSAAANFQRRRRVISSIKRRARDLRQKMPSVKDVNKIDKYSRLVFPSLFIVFNGCYWCFYLLQ